MYLVLREKLSVQRNFAIDSRLTLLLQERYSMLCVGCQNTRCVVTPWRLLWEFHCSQGSQLLREKGFLSQLSWSMRDFRLAALLTPIQMLQLILATSPKMLLFNPATLAPPPPPISVAVICFVLHYFNIFRILGSFAVFGNITAS